MKESLSPDDAEVIRERVREGYAQIARVGSLTGASCCCGPSPCGAPATTTAEQLAQSVGYTPAELTDLPEGANLGLSCGNPTALASLQPSEVVVDLGSGGGFDVFLAGPRVGPTGRVIGVDMTPDMVAKSRRNTAAYRERTGLDNVEFRLGEIEHLPVADSSVDVVISNCVINLSPEKPQVWREIARVLKPGGRAAVSDLALVRPLPAEIQEMVGAWIGCVAGAVLIADTEGYVREAGLVDIRLEQKPEYIASMTSFEDPLYRKIAAALPPGTCPADFITSLNVRARKPG
ncbi:MAG: arsenite methyltransferase [Planctomycetota bacterium]